MIHFISVLDSAVIIGTIIQFTKIVDLVFREHQKKLIQSKLEGLVLILEYSKPEKWFYTVFEKKKQRGILILVGMLLAFSIVTLELYGGRKPIRMIPSLLISISFIVVSLIVTLLGFKFYGMKILKWMTKDKFINFIYRYLKFVFIIVIPIALINISFLTDNLNFYFFISFQIVLFISGLAFVWWIITVYGYIIILYRLIIFILEILLKFSKAILWRIVEYNKGSVAAISLIITFIVGLIDVWLRVKGN